MNHHRDVWQLVERKQADLIALSDRIWGMPEPAMPSTAPAPSTPPCSKAQGFRVTKDVAGIPTAVVGEAGEGGPVIAILGEYDALPGLSQEPGVAEQRPLPGDGVGHGCGHNLLGAASLLAAAAVKDWLAANRLPGRVRYYGCPAEEGGAAKGFMVRDGAFADVDIAISWHPSAFSGVKPPLSLANTRVDFAFHGRASHAAAAPHLGRSALDAVELMNVGVNYMREHMPSDARVHYALSRRRRRRAERGAGARARVRYLIRAVRPARHAAPDRARAQDRRRRRADDRDARGGEGGQRRLQPARQRAAGARHAGHASTGSARRPSTPPTAPSPPRSRRRCTEEDIAPPSPRRRAAARRHAALRRRVPLEAPGAPHDRLDRRRRRELGGADRAGARRRPTPSARRVIPGSSPPKGRRPPRTRAWSTSAKAMATVACEALTNQALIAAAKADHATRLAREPYRCPIPDHVTPPTHMSSG